MTISKCQGTDCLKRDNCHRFTVPPLAKYQPWLVQIVSVPDTNKCKFFISNEIEEEIWLTPPT